MLNCDLPIVFVVKFKILEKTTNILCMAEKNIFAKKISEQMPQDGKVFGTKQNPFFGRCAKENIQFQQLEWMWF